MNNIASHKNIISINAHKTDLTLKNSIDQKALRTSWVMKKVKKIFASLESNPLSQTRYNETPISIYSKVHTGPKIQLGGLKKGLFKAAYHVEIAETVKKEPINPADSHNNIEIINLK